MNKEHECGGTNNGAESISRSLGHRWFSKVSSLFKGKTLKDDIWDELEEAILSLQVMPSMRALMTSGDALDRENVAGYNCS